MFYSDQEWLIGREEFSQWWSNSIERQIKWAADFDPKLDTIIGILHFLHKSIWYLSVSIYRKWKTRMLKKNNQ